MYLFLNRNEMRKFRKNHPSLRPVRSEGKYSWGLVYWETRYSHLPTAKNP